MNHKHVLLPHEPQHGHSLAEDLPRLSSQLLQRRQALAWLGAAAAPALLVAGCGGGSSGSSSGSSTTASSSTSSSSTSSSGACIADPTETGGPYPADGTNSSSGATSDVLTASGIVRSDIRSSFISSSTVAPGVPLTLTLTLVNTNASCAALSGYAIYLWHCDRSGLYSLYSAPTESYLRGVQVTDSAGQVTFTTIFPACYSGRWPHMHFEVFSSLATATVGTNSVLTSQLAMPSATCSAVYPNVTGYSASVSNFAAVSLASDNVFGDNSAAQIAAMTPTFAGSAAAGYTATATIGVAR
ncbi:protocatechuate 3,4-dioxygenase beta subunit [Polaromonas sp. CF318]|uniref:dioxygenase family protein n=1 Tax=Polaromonas sp. CF318 TaxID=1144318 RepID=UPI000271184D|nr:intradiol ring-cleavage dioxygenase [Polaromonas sp. CF318]EJL77851.1 protocatechuate 3,4-dioxygenase beta subunit [Polaromonas sp. CF318]